MWPLGLLLLYLHLIFLQEQATVDEKEKHYDAVDIIDDVEMKDSSSSSKRGFSHFFCKMNMKRKQATYMCVCVSRLL
jgi:hypothetical protein